MFLPMSNESLAVYKFCSPIEYGHHSFGLASFSPENCSEAKLTVLDSPAFSDTGWRTSLPSISARRTPLTARSETLRRSALMVKAAVLNSLSSFALTNGFRSETSPLEVRNTSFQKPMFLSGGEGFQSTQVMP